VARLRHGGGIRLEPQLEALEFGTGRRRRNDTGGFSRGAEPPWYVRAMSTTAPAVPARDNGAVELVRFLANPLEYLDGLRGDERDVVPFKLGGMTVQLVTRPEYIALALENDAWPPLSRGRLMGLRKWYTEGLFLASGPEHHRQRDDLWKPLFQDARIPEIAVARTRRKVGEWVEGRPIELYKELRAHCWAIDWEALTGTDLDAAPDLLEALELGVEALAWLVLPFGPARWSWPLPQSRRTREARQRLDAVIALMIAERRTRIVADGAGPREGEDLLTRLARLADDDELVRATFKMWFGADQLHALFTWTLWLLAQHPDVEARWHAELDDVLGDRPATEADIPSLRYTTMLIHESMRVRPPVWGFFRQTTADFPLADTVIPGGQLMAMSPWFTHRDPRYWKDPLRFDPERWAAGAPRPPDGAYFPFSAGPYECHGRGLAMKQAALILATIGQRWALRPAGPEPKPSATWATEPRRGARMKPVPRP
jgi:cytochrome P450